MRLFITVGLLIVLGTLVWICRDILFGIGFH